MIKSQIR